MKMYLIRHGQPEILEYAGFPGPKLGEKVQKQSIKIAEILQTKSINQVLGSDYTRVLETAKPFLKANKQLEYLQVVELREREKEFETHESLVMRVQNWFRAFSTTLPNQNIAIFGHCGSLNMILHYLDPNLQKMKYPYKDKYECLTPIGGIWELQFENAEFVGGELILSGKQ